MHDLGADDRVGGFQSLVMFGARICRMCILELRTIHQDG